MKTSTETTTPAGLVSRESVSLRELVNVWKLRARREARSDAANAIAACAEELERAIWPYAELPAIGVSDAMVDQMIAKYRELEPDWLEASDVSESTRKFCRQLLEAALRPSGEDRGR